MTGGQKLKDNRTNNEAVLSLVAAAHELKAPLALIRQLGLSLEGATIQDRETMTRQIVLTAERSLRLTSDITRSVRLDQALFALEPINPLALCQEVAWQLQPLYKARGRRLVVKQYKKPLLVVGNAELLRRILTNFSDNALQYADKSGSVEISTRITRTNVVRVTVRDYGPGLQLKDWKQLKDQIGSPQMLHSRPGSSGLGLMLASEFAKAMRATLGVIRHRDGVSFYVECVRSTQLSLL